MTIKSNISEMEKEIEKVRNTLEEVDFEGSLIDEFPKLNSYIALKMLEEKLSGYKKALKEEKEEHKRDLSWAIAFLSNLNKLEIPDFLVASLKGFIEDKKEIIAEISEVLK